MASISQIPIPRAGVDVFGEGMNRMFADLMKRQQMAQERGLQRERLGQQNQQFNQQLGQSDEHFKQQMALRQQQAAQAAQNAAIQRQVANLNLKKLERETDPAKQMAYMQELLHGIRSMHGQSGGAQQGGGQKAQGQPIQPFTGMGMPSYDEMQNPTRAIIPPSSEQVQQGFSDLTPDERYAFEMATGHKLPSPDILHGPARDAEDLEKLRKKEGENSDVYQNAKAQYQAQLDAKKDLRDLRERTKQGLKPGEKEFFDPKTGVPLGKEIPLTATERQSEEGNILFNELYPYVYKGASPFSGEGSIRRLEQAASNYKTDPKARKLFDDFLLSEKMLAATTVNEASTLKAGRTNRTYNMLKESLDSQDVPKVISRLIKEYKLPSSAQLRASMRYQKLLSDARNKARKGTPATQKLFYNPEMQKQYQSQTENEAESLPVIVIDPSGKRFETTEENAAHLPEGWKRG